MAVGPAAVVGLCASAVVFSLGSRPDSEAAAPGEAAVPEQLAGYSYLMESVSDSPPGAAVALYQHGFGVELMDFPQAVVLGAGGDVYRRLDLAEQRAGAETQGDPAPMLLSPDGTRVALGDHDLLMPDVLVVDLVTGTATRHELPTGRSVIPLAWSGDGRQLAHLVSPAATNPYAGGQIVGDLAVLDLDDDTATVLDFGGRASGAAFAPDGSELAVQENGADDTLSVVDLESGSRRVIEATGVLAGQAAWSPDGRLLATTTTRPSPAIPGVDVPGIPTGLAFVDPTGGDGDVPAPLPLPVSSAGRVLGWSAPDEVLTLLDVPAEDDCCGAEAYTLSGVPLDGTEPRTLMRMSGLQSYGIGRFQLASATVDDVQVVSPARVDRGDWPLPERSFLALLAGFVAWVAARVLRRVVRAVTRMRREDTAVAQEQPVRSAS